LRIGALVFLTWMLGACSEPVPRAPLADRERTVSTARRFAELVVSGAYPAAHGMLTRQAQAAYPASRIAADYERMISYGKGPGSVADPIDYMDAWRLPPPGPRDMGLSYVTVTGGDFVEAIIVVIADEGGVPKVRLVMWGRP